MANEKDKKESKQDKKTKKQIVNLNALFKDASDQISNTIYGSDNESKNAIADLDRQVDSIINSEIKSTKSITSDDMSTFLVKLFNDYDRNNNIGHEINSLDDIFNADSAGLLQFFQDRYQNQNMLYEDLKLITDQLFELSEAISTTRDSIVTSDDVSKTISRTLSFSHMSDDSDAASSYIRSIEEMEKRLKLLTKLKNRVIPNTLMYGNYYVYVCPYSKLFQEQYDKKVKEPDKLKKLSESIDDSFISSVNEGVIEIMGTENVKPNKKKDLDSLVSESVKSYAENIEISNDIVSIPLIEGEDISELITDDAFMKARKKVVKTTNVSQDGTVDINGSSKKHNDKFDEQTGCYIKYIDPRKVVPITILDTVIGYYYIHSTNMHVNKSPFSSSIRVTLTNGLPYQDTEDVERAFLSKITDKIVNAFDKPFLEKNDKFKDLILNALLYNDVYKNKLNFQFIPAEYMVEFKVNEDEEGHGQSVLTKALFYAKLYLSLLIFKMITIVTKSNDTKVYYVKNSGMDQNITNKIQEVARSIKGRQINFMDLLNYNSIISKIGSYKEIFIPVGRSGDRGIDFDVLAGQDVQLNTDLMEMLRTNMINGTGKMYAR